MEKRPTSPTYLAALRLLSRKGYSKLSLINKLQSKGFDSCEIDKAIIKLEELNYIREDFYKRSRVIKLMRQCYSVHSIQMQLEEQDNIECTTNEILAIFSEFKITEEDLIKKIINKKHSLGKKSSDDEVKIKNKVLRSLHSKGHTEEAYAFFVDEELQVT